MASCFERVESFRDVGSCRRLAWDPANGGQGEFTHELGATNHRTRRGSACRKDSAGNPGKSRVLVAFDCEVDVTPVSKVPGITDFHSFFPQGSHEHSARVARSPVHLKTSRFWGVVQSYPVRTSVLRHRPEAGTTLVPTWLSRAGWLDGTAAKVAPANMNATSLPKHCTGLEQD